MTETKGKFITMTCSLLQLNPEARVEVEKFIKNHTGKAWNQLEPEGWYDTTIVKSIFQITEKHYGTLMAKSIIKVVGRRAISIITKTTGFPKNLSTPLDWLKWEGESFQNDHRGSGVLTHRFITTEPGHVVIEATPPGYDCLLIEGVYEGILNMCDVKTYTVKQIRCVKDGDPFCHYDITWKAT